MTARSPAAACACYTAGEVADKLGIARDRFYRRVTREQLYANGMPRSLTLKPLRFPKAAFDAWLNRDHPLMPKAPAPGGADPPDSAALREWRAFLDRHYP